MANSDLDKYLTDKEISWLYFNARVLQEADDHRNTLGDRFKFLSIYSSNLDEYFRVRVATLKRLCQMGKRAAEFVDFNPLDVLETVRSIVVNQRKGYDALFLSMLAELEQEKIFIVDESHLSKQQHAFVLDYFQNDVRHEIFPIMLDTRYKFPYLKDNALYLAVELRKGNTKGKPKYCIIEIPTNVLPRFLKLPGTGDETHIILIDEIVRVGLTEIFSVHYFDSFRAYNIKITRDAELDIDEDDISVSYLHKVNRGLQKRREGLPIRFVFDQDMPESMLNLFHKKLKLHKLDMLSPGGRYHYFKDFIDFPKIAGLKTTALFQPILHPEINTDKKIFTSIRQKDILLYFPYHSFSTIIDLLREASMDPKVESIKVTLYRVANFSSIVNALMNAQKNRIEVVVLLELQARFDEENNIYWANRLQEEGVKVIFGIQGLKVHSKLALITRREKGIQTRYASIGTGNLNEDTARLYTDCCLLTADPEITMEVDRLFDFFEKNYNFQNFKRLLVSPFNLREKLFELITNEIKQAEKGKEAWIDIKVNNLADPQISKLLYKASQAGVKVRIIIRSKFALQPGIKGISENIEAISIVDKYLEHARFFLFANKGEPLCYIGSADLLSRNIDRRIELVCPIIRKALIDELRDIFNIQWKDNQKARVVDPENCNQYKKRLPDDPVIRSQDEVYYYLKEKSREKQPS